MINQDRSELIDKYLLGGLEGKELEDFQRALESDPEFAADVKVQETIFQAATDKDAMQFQDMLAEIQAEKDAEEKTAPSRIIRLPVRRLIAVAASIALLFLAGYFFFREQLVPSSPESLFATYFEAPRAEDFMDPAIISSMARGEEGAGLSPVELSLKEMADLYKDGQYVAALDKLEAINPEDLKNQPNFHYMAGVIYLVNDRPEESLSSFEKIGFGYQDGKNWYEALALLKLNRAEEARSRLEALLGASNPWQKKAKRLLRKLP